MPIDCLIRLLAIFFVIFLQNTISLLILFFLTTLLLRKVILAVHWQSGPFGCNCNPSANLHMSLQYVLAIVELTTLAARKRSVFMSKDRLVSILVVLTYLQNGVFRDLSCSLWS